MTDDTLPEYEYFIGTYPSAFTLKMPHLESTAYGSVIIPSGQIQLQPWRLRHVKSIQESESTMLTSKIGIPDKPAECAYVYDVGGPIRTFIISGERYDSEEEVSNLDFVLTQFNQQTLNSVEYIPFSESQVPATYYSVGIEWLTSTLQATMKGYMFARVASKNVTDGRVPIDILADGYGEVFNVGITNFSFEMSSDTPGLMTYTFTVVVRGEYPNSEVYREYISGFTRN